MPFGIATAPEEYQRRQHEVLEELPGIYVIADDILITGQGESKEEASEDHDRNLVEFVLGSRLAQRLFLLVLCFFFVHKNQHLPNCNSARIEHPHENQPRLIWLPL